MRFPIPAHGRPATKGLRPALPAGRGLSLRELQEIGREAGIDPERIAEAARALPRGDNLPFWRTFLSRPPELDRVVELPRAISGREWDLMVAEFRDIFGAVGEVGSQGGAREWTGGLRVLLEPSKSGHRLRMTAQNRRLLRVGRLGIVQLVAGPAFSRRHPHPGDACRGRYHYPRDHPCATPVVRRGWCRGSGARCGAGTAFPAGCWSGKWIWRRSQSEYGL
jgi:hypothetical protein